MDTAKVMVLVVFARKALCEGTVTKCGILANIKHELIIVEVDYSFFSPIFFSPITVWSRNIIFFLKQRTTFYQKRDTSTVMVFL